MLTDIPFAAGRSPAWANISISALRPYAGLLRLLLDNITEAVLVLDPDGEIVLRNRAFERLTALPVSDRLEVSTLERMLEVLGAPVDDETLAALLEFPDSTALTLELPDHRMLLCSMTPLALERQDDYRLISFRDITDEGHELRELRYRALHDRLTRLPNRDLLLDRLERALTRQEREGAAVGVIFLDLDGFKEVNDRHGHVAGDRLLVDVAGRLQRVMRRADTVGRLGGDEFLVVCDGVADSEALAAICDRIQDSLRRPFPVDDEELPLGASLGAVLEWDHTVAPNELVERADALMYTAKRQRSGTEILNDGGAIETLDLTSGGQWLRDALRDDQLWLAYLPVVTLDDDEITAVEALLRCRHPGLEDYTPPQLIELAERTRQVEVLHDWTLEQAAGAARTLQSATGGPVTVLVNLSRAQLSHPALPAATERAAAQAGIDAASLGFDIAEHVIANSPDNLAAELDSLSALGCPLFADDVSGPVVSADLLSELGFSAVKLDRAVIQRAVGDAETAASIGTLAARARALGMSTIGEGVADEESLQMVRELGCDRAQGYAFYGFPRTLSDLTRLMA